MASSLRAASHGRLRVWASDGIHTSNDASDGWFVVPNRPPVVEIFQPAEGAFALQGQTLYLEAIAYDADLADQAELGISWLSNLDGPLGEGSELSLTSLSVGTHRITAIANDGAGSAGVDTVQVTVVSSREDLPQRPNLLTASRDTLYLWPCSEVSSGTVFLHNSGGSDPISWQASANQPWLLLSKTSGETPDTVVVSVDRQALGVGTHTADVTLTNSAVPAQQVVIEVVVGVDPIDRMWFPVIMVGP